MPLLYGSKSNNEFKENYDYKIRLMLELRGILGGKCYPKPVGQPLGAMSIHASITPISTERGKKRYCKHVSRTCNATKNLTFILFDVVLKLMLHQNLIVINLKVNGNFKNYVRECENKSTYNISLQRY